MSCRIERFGGHLLHCSVAKQTLVALSSESAFYGIVRAAAFGIQTRQLLCQLGVPLRLDILCDSSAVKGKICTRSGSGKVRHPGIKELWVQEALRQNQFSLRVVDALLNWADFGEKSLEKDRLDSLILRMPLSRGERRTAAVAIAALSFLSASSPSENSETR